MNKTRCPGQDTRFWRPGDIFSVTCASCGTEVEFFKDEATRRCTACGARLQNPRLSMGCAQWCEHAKECLGFDPKQEGARDEADDRSVADRIISTIKNEFGVGSRVAEETEKAYANALRLLKTVTADPGVVVPAVLLMLADSDAREEAALPHSSAGGNKLANVKRIMKDAGVKPGAADDIFSIINAYRSGGTIESPEFRVVKNSYTGGH
jgi:hypothetical protein